MYVLHFKADGRPQVQGLEKHWFRLGACTYPAVDRTSILGQSSLDD